MPEQYRSIEGEIKLLEKTNDFIFPVELWLLNDKTNRNNWRFINLAEHRTQWAGVPILCAYIGNGICGDGHNQRTRVDPKTGEEYQSFTDATAERIVGALSDNPDDIRLEERDGYTWTVGKGFLWAFYAHELVEKITNKAVQGSVMSVSIEALVTKSRNEDGVEVEENYIPLGCTLLGDGVAPAVDGAHIAKLSEMEIEFKELKLRAASYLESAKENEPTKPQKNSKGVTKAMNFSKQQLRELQAKFSDSYVVLAALQENESVHILLLRAEDNATCAYTMGEKDSIVDTEKITVCNAQISVDVGTAEAPLTLSADACETIEGRISTLSADVTRLTDALKRVEAERDEARSTLKAMQEFESKRRVSAAKEKAKTTLAAFNANRQDKVSEDVLSAVNADIEGGVYAACVDKDGNWMGEALVEEKVLSACAKKVMEFDRVNATRDNGAYIWDKLGKVNAMDDGSIQGLLARKGII